jgi:uncharacterized protein (TIGR00255 family)
MSAQKQRASRGTVSMTGYGVASVKRHGIEVTAEIRSVNHRYFECQCRLPQHYAALDHELRESLRSTLVRGKVDLTVRLDVKSQEHRVRSELNEQALLQVVKSMKRAYQLCGITPDAERLVAQALSRSEIFTVQEDRLDEGHEELIKSAVHEALRHLASMRAREGVKLSRDVVARIKLIKKVHAFVARRAGAIAKNIRTKVESKLNQAAGVLPEKDSRFHAEVVYQTDKSDISEELVRLAAHLDELLTTIQGAASQGKRVEFLLQEVHRELTTLGNKIPDPEVQHRVVDAKVEIEKIREQIQNIV